jgi:hypothetical protein
MFVIKIIKVLFVNHNILQQLDHLTLASELRKNIIDLQCHQITFEFIAFIFFYIINNSEAYVCQLFAMLMVYDNIPRHLREVAA